MQHTVQSYLSTIQASIQNQHNKRHEDDDKLSQSDFSNQNDDYDQGDDNMTSKRRTKETQGRDYKCTYCSKTYLSYPALYTHQKNKHAIGPDGNPIPSLNPGRGRGRPKKFPGPQYGAGMYRSNIEPNSSKYFKSLEKQGGPIFPDICFEQIYAELYLHKMEEQKIENMSQETVTDRNENTLDNKFDSSSIHMYNNPDNQNENQEYYRKKRGRKPKSYYIQKILDEQR